MKTIQKILSNVAYNDFTTPHYNKELKVWTAKTDLTVLSTGELTTCVLIPYSDIDSLDDLERVALEGGFLTDEDGRTEHYIIALPHAEAIIDGHRERVIYFPVKEIEENSDRWKLIKSHLL